jgi:hypothetical protein
MRFMIMHKMTEAMERGEQPDPAVCSGVDQLLEEGLKNNIFISGEGLKPSSERVHVVYKGGKRTVTEGPFADPKELVGGFGLFQVSSREEALVWCDRFAAVLGDVELYMGPVVEAWDMGVAPKPDTAPLRFLALHKWEPHHLDSAPNPELDAKMGALIGEMMEAGVLQATGSLASTEHGARISYRGGRRTVIDGPFAESKELVAGYAIIDVPSKADAIEWAQRFGDVVQVNEIEVRQMNE